MVLVDCSVPFVFLVVSSIALLLLFFALTWISKRSESLLCSSAPYWGSIGWWRFIRGSRIAVFRNDAMVDGGGAYPPSLSLVSGADDLVTRVSNGTKGRRRVDYVLSKNFLFAHVESCCVLEFHAMWSICVFACGCSVNVWKHTYDVIYLAAVSVSPHQHESPLKMKASN
jgi:hypothetical protein